MDIFDIDPNALIILVIMIIGGLKWLLERMKGPQEQDDDQATHTFEDLYEEARREIKERQNRQSPTQEEAREALQQYEQPTIFQPPPVPSSPPPLPGKKPKPSFKKPAYDSSAPPPSVLATLSAAEQAALDRIKAGAIGSLRPKRRRPSHPQVRRLLATPSAAKDAIVLREILGPPKGSS